MAHHLLLNIISTLFIQITLGQVNLPTDYLKAFSGETKVNGSTTYISESKDMGPCTCDLHQGVCDYLCCCDSDCPKDQIDLWRSDPRRICKTYNDSRMENYLCMNESETYNYNSFRSGAFYRDQVSNLLCVTWDNSRDMGEFYLTPPNITTIDDLYYNPWKTVYFGPTAQGTPISYSYGKLIQEVGGEKFFWYQSDPYGNCIKTNGIKFLVPNKKVTCNNKLNLRVSNLPPTLATGANNQIELLSSPSYYQLNGNALTSMTTTLPTTPCVISSLIIHFFTQNYEISSIKTTIICRDEANTNKRMTFETKWFNVSNTQPDFKSGNPGYSYKKPVLLLQGGNTLYEKGIYIRGSEIEGNCHSSATHFNPYDEPIQFGVDSIYTCNLPSPNAFLALAIHPFLSTIGRFGSSNPLILEDWNTTNTTGAIFAITPGMDKTIVFEIMTSKFGLKSQPQAYILGSKIVTFDEYTGTTPKLRFITKFIPVTYDLFIESPRRTSLPPLPSSVNNTV